MARPARLIAVGLLLLAQGLQPLLAEEGLSPPGQGMRLDPGLEWLPVEREPVLKVVPEVQGPILRGKASYYGKTSKFQGRRTANGERFDRSVFTAASNRFPLGSWIAVRRPGTEHCVVVWVNDRMHSRHKVRIVDLSMAAAQSIQMVAAGVVAVEARALRGAPGVEPAICLQAFEADTDFSSME